MHQQHTREFDSLVGTRRFLDAHADIFGFVNASPSRKRLDEIVVQVQENATVQLAAARAERGMTEARVQSEVGLRRGHIMPIAEYARARMTGLGEGEFKALTPATGKLTGARLVQAALAMAKVATAHLDELEAGNFPADVVTQLVAAADAVQANLHDRARLGAEKSGATQRIAQILSEGRAIVRTIGAVVKRTAQGDNGMLAEWRSAQRVKVKPVMPAREEKVAGTIAPVAPGGATAQEVKVAA